MFWFMLVALVAVVGAVALISVGAGGGLPDVPPDRVADSLPGDRPVQRADVEALRLPVVFRGYRMLSVEDALDRLGAELAQREARIAELEAQLAGERAAAMARPPSAESPGESQDAAGDQPRYPQQRPGLSGGPGHREQAGYSGRRAYPGQPGYPGWPDR